MSTEPSEGAYLMKNEAAADEDAELDVLGTGAASPGWLELPSRQGVRVPAVMVAVMVAVVVVTGASEAATSVSASPVKP